MLFEEIRNNIASLGKEIAASGFNLGTWGNISARIDDDHFAITPSGIAYETITAEDIIVIDLAGNIIKGNKKPSIELPLHSAIYKAKKNIKAIIHTHSVCCTAFAIARKPIPAVCEDMIQIVGGQVEVAEYFLPGSNELALSAITALKGKTACILANHGLLTAADTLDEAYKISQIVEKSAQAVIYANSMGGAIELSQSDVDFMRDFYLNQYGQK
ncbi:MAG: class II aldolase/adducin family protein [Candidatus Cloacimonetes bacterium]|jgi:L-fuculose-phosphate aldolase|nr:class II aldolase/adducin family protein [Candidatus Cloacimonadota bacterium]